MMKDGLYQHLIIQGRPVPPNMARRTKTRAHSVRFELTRGDPSRFRVCRLNRSATNAHSSHAFLLNKKDCLHGLGCEEGRTEGGTSARGCRDHGERREDDSLGTDARDGRDDTAKGCARAVHRACCSANSLRARSVTFLIRRTRVRSAIRASRQVFADYLFCTMQETWQYCMINAGLRLRGQDTRRVSSNSSILKKPSRKPLELPQVGCNANSTSSCCSLPAHL